MARELCSRPENAALAKDDFFFQTLESGEDAANGGPSSVGDGSSSGSQVVRSGSDTSIDH